MKLAQLEAEDRIKRAQLEAERDQREAEREQREADREQREADRREREVKLECDRADRAAHMQEARG